MSGEQPPSPLAPGGPSLVEWRLSQVERDINSVNAWREKASEQLTTLTGDVRENTRRLNQIAAVSVGTFVTVLGGLVLYLLTGGHH